MTDYDVTQYTCNDGNIAKILIPNNVTEDDLRGLYELLQVVAARRFGLDLSEREAVQGCDGCRHNTRIPQEHCLRCKRYWRDSYERKGGDDE